jgi:acylphosphatase
MKAIHAHYEGKVQGVGFRASILSLAKGYEVTGWVRNLADGRVHLLASGEDEEVEEFLRGINESHLAGHIEQVSLSPVVPEPGLRGFRIID